MNRSTLATIVIGSHLAAAAVVVGAVAVPARSAEVIRDHPVVHGAIAKATGRACAEEDSVNCFWNARRQGNGEGHSHYNVQVGDVVCVIYWGERYNRRHGYCF